MQENWRSRVVHISALQPGYVRSGLPTRRRIDGPARPLKPTLKDLASLLAEISLLLKGLMTYETAAKVTTLGVSTLERLVSEGRFKEGRHYIREGIRVLFHYNLVDLMFEDKIRPDDSFVEEKSSSPAKATSVKPARVGNKCGINLEYGDEC